ncbi:glycosyltransferase family 2 protein [Sporomusa sp. GT1]|uniref:glycosyltransferase family 2 protein n=1 Tax=Sporomusa sp. GT1 TaxID=1534747 RepID=UPI00166CCF23|nr:glycosyltransferase family 2 protein [Sporomusa sp. GT1]
MNPKISVIVPVYNTELYLRECMESLLSQSLKEIEFICIDDASTDCSYEILCEYTERDSRIRLIRNPNNAGVGETRNKGIDHARGECLYFMDSDDTLESHALEKLYEQLHINQLDICYFKTYIHYEIDRVECSVYAKKGIISSYSGCCTGPKRMSDFLNNGDFFYYPCLALYNKKFIDNNHLRFAKLKIGEGGLFSISAIIRAKRVAVLDDRLYHYRIRSFSATTSLDAKRDSVFGQFIQYVEVLKLLAKECCPVASQALKQFLEQQVSKVQGHLRNSPKLAEFISSNLDADYERHILAEVCMPSKAYFKGFDSEQEEKILCAHTLIVYGAGLASLDVLCALNALEKEILGFAVTNKPLKTSLYGHHLYMIDELTGYSRQALVIVATNRCYHQEIEEKLKGLGFFQYIMLNIII